MIRCPRSPGRRPAAAAVEMAVVMNLIVVPLMLGMWEMGRVIQVQQVVGNAAREGARLAAQARTINATGAPTEIQTAVPPSSNSTLLPNVTAAVMQSLHGAGLTNLNWPDADPSTDEDVIVTFEFLDTPSGGVPGATQPWQGVKNQRFRVTVTLTTQGYHKVRWLNFGLINPDSITYEVDWRMLVDDPFGLNTDLPNW